MIREGIRQSLVQMMRFLTVGSLNTLIDFGVMNLLVWGFAVHSTKGLLVVSLVACSLATLNSFFLNKTWTFGSRDGNRLFARFVSVSLLAMAVNISIFLFLNKYLVEKFGIGGWVGLNLAKTAGVGVASVVGFLGYRLGVFSSQSFRIYRRTFQFHSDQVTALDLTLLVGLALLVRLAYLGLTTAVFGDAVNYSWIAHDIARGRFEQIDTFWSNLYCYWEAIFVLFGLEGSAAAITASLVPGALLVLPVTWMAGLYYGRKVALFAGSVTVLHPRLIEYSANGYSEAFYLLAVVTGTALVCHALKGERKLWQFFLAGMCFGVFYCVRNEGLILMGLMTLTLLALCFKSRPLWPLGVFVCGFLVLSAFYVFLSTTTLGTPGLFQKTTVLAKEFSEQTDMARSAREVYGADGSVWEDSEPKKRSLRTFLFALPARFSSNAIYTLERLPGILLGPMIVFALILPLCVRSERFSASRLPLVLLLVFPLVFYPLLQVEPRYLFLMLVPIHIFGAAGFFAFADYFVQQVQNPKVVPALLTCILLGTAGISLWRGLDVEKGHQIHRQLAHWLKDHVEKSEVLYGCGYGYVSTTGFLSRHRTSPRVWSDNPAEVAQFVRRRGGRWLIIYEAFLKKGNPELLPILETGLPGADLMFESRSSVKGRAQVYFVR